MQGNVAKQWCVDSGTTTHMTNNKYLFQESNQEKKRYFFLADRNVTQTGSGLMHCKTSGDGTHQRDSSDRCSLWVLSHWIVVMEISHNWSYHHN